MTNRIGLPDNESLSSAVYFRRGQALCSSAAIYGSEIGWYREYHFSVG
jgi:hypothetical protein